MKYTCRYCGQPTDNEKIIPLYDGTKYVIHRCNNCEDRLTRVVDWEQENAHLYEDTIVCPYCDYPMEAYDAYSYIEYGNDDNVECPECGKHFKLEVHQTVEFSTFRRAEDMPEDYGEDMI